jgi:hypothetical protein
MRLRIIGCPEKKDFQPFVRRAAEFYANELISKKMLDNIFVKIKFNKKLDVYGYASVEECNDSGKPREFLIEVNPLIGARDILKTIAHEMVHIKQYAYCETNEAMTHWKGTRINSDDIDYWDHPWEIEAHGREDGLFTKFANKECLWEVFKMSNPNDPIKQEPLGWRT